MSVIARVGFERRAKVVFVDVSDVLLDAELIYQKEYIPQAFPNMGA